MPVDHIRYDLLVQDALRGVVRRVLGEIAKKGLTGDHHFYIDFDTRAPGVRMSSRLLAHYPEEMRIVLQHQFWDLVVAEHAFEVGLSFNGVAERLLVPFTAIKGFFDPSVQFGLQFEVSTDDDAAAPASAEVAPLQDREAGKPTRPAKRPSALPPAVRKAPATGEGATSPAEEPAKASEPPPEEKPAASGAEVVSLDRFRKK
jgi:uncharacterized protein